MWDAQYGQHLLVEKEDTARRQRTHRELLIAWSSKLSHYKHVERYPKLSGHLIRDGNATATEGEHGRVPQPSVSRQIGREHSSRMEPVSKATHLPKLRRESWMSKLGWWGEESR